MASFYMSLTESHICDNETGTVGRWQLCAAHIGTNPHAYRGEQRHNMHYQARIIVSRTPTQSCNSLIPFIQQTSIIHTSRIAAPIRPALLRKNA